MATTTETNVELLAVDPDAIARQIAEGMHRLGSEATSSELVYTPTGGECYFRDLLAARGFGRSAGAQERLARHGEQMEQLAKVQRERAERQLHARGIEFRIEPNRTTGQGGYFTPPAWLNQLFATANRPGRVLSDLMPKFPLPQGVATVSLPLLSTGTSTVPQVDNSAVADQDIVDAAGTSAVVPLAGQADVALQALEQSPVGAHLDWAIFTDLREGHDGDLETQLIYGTGGTATATAQLPGILTLSGAVNVPYTGSVSGAAMYPSFGKVAAQIGDGRLRPPECWLMRTARWAWIQTSEDTATLPFGLYSPYYIGNTDDTPDPIGAIAGWPVFLNDAIPANLTGSPGSFTFGGGTQDAVICLRPSDMILLEGEPQTMVAREPLSGNLGARIQMHGYAAAITGRHPAGIGVLGGSGFAVATGF